MALASIALAADTVGGCITWVQLQGSGTIGDGLIEPAFEQVGMTALAKGERILRIAADRLGRLLDDRVELAQAGIHLGASEAGTRVRGIQLNGLGVIPGSLIVAMLLEVSIAPGPEG